MSKCRHIDKNRLFGIQFWVIFVILMLILVQGFTHFIPFKVLGGHVESTENVDLSFKTYLNGSYQDFLTERAKEKGGFREFFIRSYNQAMFNCFREISNDNVIEGENKEFFLKMYLEESTGGKLLSYHPSIDSAKRCAEINVEKTLVLIDSLRKHGTAFFFVFAPTKPAVYPECIPEKYQKTIVDFSMQEYYVQLFKEKGIPHIDFTSYFKSIKDSVSYPLYTRLGTHWSRATLPLVGDTIMKKMAAVSGLDLPSFECVDMNPTCHYDGADYELEGLMNLLFPFRNPEAPRPVTTLSDTIGKDKPHLLVIGDSYFVQLENSPFVNAFSSWDYWKYNRDIVSSNPCYCWQNVNRLPEAYDVLEQADIVMAIITAPYIYEYMWGFCETASRLFQQRGNLSVEERVAMIIQEIQGNPEWLESVKQQAEKEGLTFEENLRRNAIYVLENRK